MKLKFPCPSCRKTLSCNSSSSGEKSDCPSCGTNIKTPFPGIGIGKFWGGWLLLAVGTFFVMGMLGSVGAEQPLGLIALLAAISLNLRIKYLRVINIGLSPHWTWFGLVPWISTIWFGVASTGSAKRKIIPSDMPPAISPDTEPLKDHLIYLEKNSVTENDKSTNNKSHGKDSRSVIPNKKLIFGIPSVVFIASSLLICVVFFMFVFNALKPEVKISGKPVSYWIERIEDRNPNVASEAIKTLHYAEKSEIAKAEKILIRIAEDSSSPVRMDAAQILFSKFGVTFLDFWDIYIYFIDEPDGVAWNAIRRAGSVHSADVLVKLDQYSEMGHSLLPEEKIESFKKCAKNLALEIRRDIAEDR